MSSSSAAQPGQVNTPDGLTPYNASAARPCVRGKFIFAGDEKLYVRGMSYGPFKPRDNGCEYHDPQTVARDFELMAAHGVNAVRTYTVPPRWLLDQAQQFGLRVMIGLPWEQHVAFLDDSSIANDIERRVRAGVQACSAHPAVLCYTVGNEIPSPIARWHGRHRVENFIERLYRACKQEDPAALVTYANYPCTEYLDLPFLDFVSFNVYLETQSQLEAYLARLQNIAHERPLVVTEFGLDALRHGSNHQAQTLDWQVRTIFAGGCAGAFVFSWTDEWFRGGCEIEGWQFGVTTRQRQPKPALERLRQAFAEVPFPPQVDWPKVSVVVCTHNGGRTLAECLAAVQRLDYPSFETIVVDDGSRDDSAQIARSFAGVQLIQTPNRGLSSARNTGMRAATGQIIAYLDDDAYPDRHWLKYLVRTFLISSHAGVGGPNVAPADDGFRAGCVARAPGGPMHVLLTDTTAEHIPGCNMAFRRQALLDIGGFDEQFRIAGDDVDICWRLQQSGATLGFSPAAMVWHHRRGSVCAYWRQQVNYGRAEAALERKWPAKYNLMGNPTWIGRLYSSALLQTLGWRSSRIYHGTWGSALFQSVYHIAPTPLLAAPTTPEWYLIILVLGAISAWSALWLPLVIAIPLLLVAVGISAAQALIAARRSCAAVGAVNRSAGYGRLLAVTSWLHLIQPAARLVGRIREGLTPWRHRGPRGWALPWRSTAQLWSGQWQSIDQRLRGIEAALRELNVPVIRGGDFDDWDLEVRGGMTGSARLCITVEEHGNGVQMVKLRAWPRCLRGPAVLAIVLIVICDASALAAAWETWAASGIVGLMLLGLIFRDIGSALTAIRRVTADWTRTR